MAKTTLPEAYTGHFKGITPKRTIPNGTGYTVNGMQISRTAADLTGGKWLTNMGIMWIPISLTTVMMSHRSLSKEQGDISRTAGIIIIQGSNIPADNLFS